MKKMILIFALVMVALAPVLSHADDGLYIGLEAYGRVFPNVYLGAGVAAAGTAELLSTEDTGLFPSN